MARARNIKPALFKNEILGVADPLLTLLFEGLWLLADKEGRLEDRPLRIRGEIFPYREGLDMEEMLDWLAKEQFVLRYSVGAKSFIQITNFEKHQNPHRNEPESVIPAFDALGTTTDFGRSPTESVGSAPADSLSLIPDSLIPDSLTADVPPADIPAVVDLFAADMPPAKVVAPVRADYPDDFEIAWAAYPKRPGMNKKESHKAYAARVKSGHDPTLILAGVQRYAKFCVGTGKVNTEFVKQPATFFGPNEHFLEAWAFVPQPSKGPQGSKNGSLATQNYRAGVASNGAF